MFTNCNTHSAWLAWERRLSYDVNYFEVKIDGRSLGYYNKDARSKFIRDRPKDRKREPNKFFLHKRVETTH